MADRKFPYKCTIVDSKKEFIPTMIDFDNCMVWHQKGQASGNGEWLSLDEVYITRNEDPTDFENYLLNSAQNYTNGEKVGIFDVDDDYKIER